MSLPPLNENFTVIIHHATTVQRHTRRWAAWTHREEESFFNALQQVGKNFDKITCNVQSKNKEQVRHYYYRLVKRMNKLLGPGIHLDTKNSKDTVSAMLRWWSLLEKFNCTASKLHLKPRRFKIFLEALESQLQKDRRKTRKRRSKEENCSLSVSSGMSNGVRDGSFMIKHVDAQNSRILGKKIPFFKWNVGDNINANAGTVAGVLPAATMKQKKTAGIAASSAYSEWEKAAIAGVSLVADAAEQLEHASIELDSICNKGVYSDQQNENHDVSLNLIQDRVQLLTKLKLQLYPINEATRKALEMDDHNPHLELTLSGRKKILSVLEHLSRKWGHSNAAIGELMLFPYCTDHKDVGSLLRWTKKDTAAVADVFISIGSPAIFRLRYGWFPMPEIVFQNALTDFHSSLFHWTVPQSTIPSHPDSNKVDPLLHEGISQHLELQDGQPLSSVIPSTGTAYKEVERESTSRTKEVLVDQIDMDTSGARRAAIFSTVEWHDTFSNISMGEFLGEAPQITISTHVSSVEKKCLSEGIALGCDSFDIAIAELQSRKEVCALHTGSSKASILALEETCNGSNAIMTVHTTNDINCSTSSPFGNFFQDLEQTVVAVDSANIEPSRECLSADVKKDISLHTHFSDTYWPDSQGPFYLEIPVIIHQSQDNVLSDGQYSWNYMMDSSQDAFRNVDVLWH